jgi:hypothetical protein
MIGNVGMEIASPWKKLLEQPGPQGHLVQFYDGGDGSLTRNAGLYLLEGLKRRDGLLVIADPSTSDKLKRELEQYDIDVGLTVRNGQLLFADAQETLARFMRGGQPDWDLFEIVLGTAMRQVRPKVPRGGLRAYGEMVGILWKSGQFSAAARLEQFWNKLLGRLSFSLFCGYSIDVFGRDFQVASLDALLCAHTHLLPGTGGNLEKAINVAMEEVLGPDTHDLKSLITANFRPSWAVMPRGEAMILWLKHNLPGQADEILSRARHHYQATDRTTDRTPASAIR